jgi:hypothetical protein
MRRSADDGAGFAALRPAIADGEDPQNPALSKLASARRAAALSALLLRAASADEHDAPVTNAAATVVDEPTPETAPDAAQTSAPIQDTVAESGVGTAADGPETVASIAPAATTSRPVATPAEPVGPTRIVAGKPARAKLARRSKRSRIARAAGQKPPAAEPEQSGFFLFGGKSAAKTAH